MSNQNYRLYSFVAGLYLSELQKGLQTAHVVSEIASLSMEEFDNDRADKVQTFRDWADHDKTIIICTAMNHQGVLECWAELERINSALGLPAAIFHEDEQSMNSMATACGIVVPQKYWDTTPVKSEAGVIIGWEYEHDGGTTSYSMFYPEGQFINHIKQYRLA